MSGDALRDEVELLERSLEDARREHAAGELDDAALARIESVDGARLAAARERLAAATPATTRSAGESLAAVRPGRRRSRLVLGLASLAIAGALAAVAAINPFAGSPPRPDLGREGELLLLVASARAELAKATVPSMLRALTFYDAALRLAPRESEALVESGWLRYEVGGERGDRALVRAGIGGLRRAARLLPDSAAAHLYLGIALFQYLHDRSAALVQLRRARALPETPSEQAYTQLYLHLARR